MGDLASSFTPQNAHTSFLLRLRQRELSGRGKFRRSLKLPCFHRITIWRCLSRRGGTTPLHFSTDDFKTEMTLLCCNQKQTAPKQMKIWSSTVEPDLSQKHKTQVTQRILAVGPLL